MHDRSLLSRAFHTLGVLLRRFTIGLGALILVLYFFGDWLFLNWPSPACSEWPKSRLANDRGDVAAIAVQGCMMGLLRRQYLVRVRLAGSASAKLVLRFKPKKEPALRWLDDDRLMADLGEVNAISPAIEQAGPVHISFTYSGASPSLD